MHTEWVKESDGGSYPIEVADADDITCECGKIVYLDDSIMCDMCDKRFCKDCIVTKPSSDWKICYGCLDDMTNERLNREN